jgi:hypothetical protein
LAGTEADYPIYKGPAQWRSRRMAKAQMLLLVRRRIGERVKP